MNLLKETQLAQKQLYNVTLPTSLIGNLNLSNRYGATILLKREDQQIVRSFKIRGACNKINSLSNAEKKIGIISASDGNHAEAVAYCCQLLKTMGKIYMPKNTPNQKVKQVQLLGKNYIEIVLAGNFFDEAYVIAQGDASIHRKAFIHPFDDLKVIAGQGTVGLEILEEYPKTIDYVFVPFEGGGLTAGLSTVFKQLSPNTKIIGVAAQDNLLFEISNQNKNSLDTDNQFVFNTTIKKKDNLTSDICQKNQTSVIKIPKGKICSTFLQLFNYEDSSIEFNGVLPIAALDHYTEQIKGKNVVCIISNGLKDMEREEIRERSLLFEGLVHYFMIHFPQHNGILKEFINHVLGPDDEVTYFQSIKKDNCDAESVLVRLKLKNPNNILAIKASMLTKKMQYQNLSEIYESFTPNIILENTVLERKA